MTSDVLDRLAGTIAARKGADPGTSHTAKLLARGPAKCAEKFGEEAVEAVIEAVRGDRDALIAEGADTLYHLLVMLASRDVSLDDVLAELARREGVSGVTEKAARAEAPVVREAFGQRELDACFAIRATVFITEQGVERALEVDGLDEACRHYIALVGGEAVGTARILPRGAEAKVQRVAVSSALRGRGVGAAIMRRIIEDLEADPDVGEIYLESQINAVPFYERLGFEPEGETFMDAGIPHQAMRRKVQRG